MKRFNHFILLAATLLLAIGCAEEAATQQNNGKGNQQEPDTKELTDFVIEDTTPKKTRTTAEYYYNSETDRGLHFYWTAGDRLWVNNGGTLTQDTHNTINDVLVNTTTPGGVRRATKACFSFEGTFTASTYPVRYTGAGNPASDKVTIKAQQRQNVPNDASHIATDGDCGVATAIRPTGSNQYKFTLTHKAAYATFLPYDTEGARKYVEFRKIKITADQPLAGTYNFNDNGLDLTSPTDPSNTIELTLRGEKFTLPQTPTPATNAATIVIAPGTYTNFKVEYYVTDYYAITKIYPSVTFIAGKNKKISQDFQDHDLTNKFYMWDAKYHYWYGHINADGQPDRNYPLNNSDPRWCHEGNAPLVATESCKDCPNVNELFWYAKKGDPHLEQKQEIYFVDGRIELQYYRVWLRKKSAIVDYLKNHEGYPASLTWNDMKEAYWNSPTAPHVDGRATSVYFNGNRMTIGVPANLADYFWIPIATYYIWHTFTESFGTHWSYYWSSTPTPGSNFQAYALYLDAFNNEIGVHRRLNRDRGMLKVSYE